MKKLLYLIWLLPFVCFFGAFMLVQRTFYVDSFDAPNIVGLPLHIATKKLASHQLNIRIAGQKTDDLLEEDTVIDQNPSAGQQIKPNQALYLIISKKSEKPLLPDFKGLQREEIIKKAVQLECKVKFYRLATNGVHDSCLFQTPQAGQPVPNELQIYICANDAIPYIVGSLKGLSLTDAMELIKDKQIKTRINARSEQAHWQPIEQLVIVDQRPLPGTVINRDTMELDLIVDAAQPKQ